ncbi:hypothetical protein [Longispora urticae]
MSIASPASPREDALTTFFGAWLVGGALADGWAHNNIRTLETIFTPWHAILYSGFIATGLWTVFLAHRRRAAHRLWWRDAWPAGYRTGVIGAVIFFFAGNLDLVWHSVFGIETDLDALFSPTHVGLAIGSGLLLTSPLRSWWAAGSTGTLRTAAGVGALVLGTTSTAVFLIYASAFQTVQPTVPYAGAQGTPGYLAAAMALTAYLVTTALLVLPLTLVLRRRAAVPGAATALVAVVAAFAVGLLDLPRTQTVAALAAVGGAIAVDLLLGYLDRTRGLDAPLRLPVAGAVFAAVVWSAHLLALDLVAGVRWPVELWSGTVVMSAAVGALIGGLAARPVPAEPATREAGPAVARTPDPARTP